MKTRLKLVTVQLTPEESFQRWKNDVLCALDELKNVIESPLPVAKQEYSKVNPGDPGYEEAVYEVVINNHPLVFKLPVTALRREPS